MIDAQRAIEILKVQKSFLADINIDAHMAYKLAIESLEWPENQTAVAVGKVIIDEQESSGFHETCPTCGKFVYDDYCSGCGEKLDWD